MRRKVWHSPSMKHLALLLVLACLSACPAPQTPYTSTDPRPVQSACHTDADCATGICEGQGCGETPGRCAPRDRVCTKDLATYCGCDGQTFQASGSCPSARFQNKGQCLSAVKADGQKCSQHSDCGSGICEGQGCEEGQGICVPNKRMCTRDIQPYCGCDGNTFHSSGSCPGARYATKGECQSAKAANGTQCLTSEECDSGVCEGQGCTSDTPGVCVAKKRMCTRDLVPFCGCDGQTFRNSSRCPSARYKHAGSCR